MKRLTLFVAMFAGMVTTLHAQKVLTVAQDESGDYSTIQAAVDAVAEGEEAIINIKAGTYEGMVKVGTRQKPSTKKISMMGEGMDKTILTAANGKNNIGNGKDLRDYATLGIFAPDFYAQDLCIQNTGGSAAGQAIALHLDGDRGTFYRCKIAGYQDPHRTKKETRSYYKDCVIEGAVDYIYAGGTAWFENCTLNSVGNGYITAPEDLTVYTTAEDGTKIWLGFIFNNCTITKNTGVTSVALGRCWGAEKCGSMFLNCNLNNIIKAAGWETMGGNDGTKSYYAEYKSMNGTELADVSNRIGWSHQLSDADYQKVNTWAKVDAAYRAIKTTAPAYNPEAVIAAHQTIDDYADIEQNPSQMLAFPTARGFGKFASGGRGGKVVEVTNLNDSGEGSLRWALTEAGLSNATIVFKVSGTITLKSDIRAKLQNVTIAGQTAPGEGILYRGGKLNLGGCNNVIIRNIRGRLGSKSDEQFVIDDSKTINEQGNALDAFRKANFIAGGAIGIENAANFIIDHSCFGWSGEENMTVYDNHFTTVQWCIIHEGLYNAGHQKGARGYGCQWGGSPATFHHNLLAHNDSRSPRFNGASNENQDRNVFMEYFNNVNYNWGRQNSCYGGENEAGDWSSHECNFVGNYYKPGPARTSSSYFIEMSKARKDKTLNGPSIWYLDGNKMEGNATATANNWSAISNQTGYALVSTNPDVPSMKATEFIAQPTYATAKNHACLSASKFDNYADYMTPQETADEAFAHVLAKAGTINRDAVERRIIEDVTTGTAKYKGIGYYSGSQNNWTAYVAAKGGVIDSPADCEGYYEYAPATAYTDNDHDGMDDAWELQNGFDPTNAEDRNVVASKEGYTALEIFLNSLMGEPIQIITGIRSVTADKSLKGVSLYSLNGMQLAQTKQEVDLDQKSIPSGVYIVRKQFSDGSVQVKKIAKK